MKILITICAILSSLNIYAQHLIFNDDIVIDGSISSVTFYMLRNGFVRESKYDREGRIAFSGQVNDKRSFVKVFYDCKRPINDSLVYAIKVFSFFETKEEVVAFAKTYYSSLVAKMGKNMTNVDIQGDYIISRGDFEVGNDYGIVEAKINKNDDEKFSLETKYTDFINEERVSKMTY